LQLFAPALGHGVSIAEGWECATRGMGSRGGGNGRRLPAKLSSG
jgi:hypothetical protein